MCPLATVAMTVSSIPARLSLTSLGDSADGIGGNDTILNSGTVDGDIVGDVACTGGDDLITNTGSANDILGDGACAGGNDTINHSGTANIINGELGDDEVNVQFGATVLLLLGGEDPGDGDFDVITFTDLTQASRRFHHG